MDMVDLASLNYWAILVATVASFALGGLWYGPLFGKSWLLALGKTEDDIPPSATPFVVTFFTTLITCVVMACFVQMLGIMTWVGGLYLGVAVGGGFIAMSMLSDTLFCRWSLNLFFIQAGYRAVYSIIMGLILALWQ